MPSRIFGGPVSQYRKKWTIADHSIDDDAKPMAAKYLAKWRPRFLEQNSDVKKIEDSERLQLNSAQSTPVAT
jgi:hypothetical protein